METFICYTFFIHLMQKKKHENVCKNSDYCSLEIPQEDSILKYNHGEKSIKI